MNVFLGYLQIKKIEIVVAFFKAIIFTWMCFWSMQHLGTMAFCRPSLHEKNVHSKRKWQQNWILFFVSLCICITTATQNLQGMPAQTYNDVIVLYAVQLLEISGWKMLYLLLECHAVHQMHFIHRHKQSIHWSSSSFWSFYSFQLRWSLWTDETKFSSVSLLSNCSFDDTKMRWDEMKKDIAKCFFSPSSALIHLYRLVLYSVLFVHYTKKGSITKMNDMTKLHDYIKYRTMWIVNILSICPSQKSPFDSFIQLENPNFNSTPK